MGLPVWSQNAAKTKFVLFSRQRHPPSTSLTLDGSSIHQVSSVKYLEVILSKDLTWNDHINSLCLVSFLYIGLQVSHVSANSTNPLFSQLWTIVQASGTPGQYYILIPWIHTGFCWHLVCNYLLLYQCLVLFVLSGAGKPSLLASGCFMVEPATHKNFDWEQHIIMFVSPAHHRQHG